MAEETEVKKELDKPVTPAATPEPSHLDELEKSILSTEKKEDKPKETPGEKAKEGDEDETIDFDWDKAMEKHPKLAKLGVKDIGDALERYEGGLEDFQRNAQIVKELKKLGYETPGEREELFKKLAAKEEITPPAKSEEQKTSRQIRNEKLAKFIPQQVCDPDKIDPDTGEVQSGELRPITEEEKVAKQRDFENFAESISSGDLPDTVDRIERESLDREDDLDWLRFQLEPILNKYKDEVIPDSVRTEIIEHSKKFPQTYSEIIQKARKEGKPIYPAVYHYFTSTTKKEQIDAEKKKQWEAEYKTDEEKRKAAQAETTEKPGEPGKAKTFSDMSLAEKEKHIEAQK